LKDNELQLPEQLLEQLVNQKSSGEEVFNNQGSSVLSRDEISQESSATSVELVVTLLGAGAICT
jgi:hypothetical protein